MYNINDMQKKIILIAVTIIAIISLGLYFVFPSIFKEKPIPEVLPVAPAVERYQFQDIEYEFISVGGPVYDIITGQLSEEQVKTLAEKIIEDLVTEDPDIKEITLLFYSDLIAAGVGEADVAQIDWTPKEINIKII
jgi:hypothetical protein